MPRNYKLGKKVYTNLEELLGKRRVYKIDLLEEQGRTIAFSKLKTDLENLGLQVTII